MGSVLFSEFDEPAISFVSGLWVGAGEGLGVTAGELLPPLLGLFFRRVDLCTKLPFLNLLLSSSPFSASGTGVL